MAVNTDKFIIEVALEWAWPPLRIELFVASSFGQHNGGLICSAPRTVDVLVFASGAFLLGLA